MTGCEKPLARFQIPYIVWFAVSIYNIIWFGLGLIYLKDPWGFPFQAENWLNNPNVNATNTILFSQIFLVVGIMSALTALILLRRTRIHTNSIKEKP